MNKYEKMDWWFKDLTPERLPMCFNRCYICVVLIVTTVGGLIGLTELLGTWLAILVYLVVYILAGVASMIVPEIIKETWRHKEQYK